MAQLGVHTELQLLNLEQQEQREPTSKKRATRESIQARLWCALELNASFTVSLQAIRKIGLELPPVGGHVDCMEGHLPAPATN